MVNSKANSHSFCLKCKSLIGFIILLLTPATMQLSLNYGSIDHGGLGFRAQKYHPQAASPSFITVVGTTKPINVFRTTPKPFKQVSGKKEQQRQVHDTVYIHFSCCCLAKRHASR